MNDNDNDILDPSELPGASMRREQTAAHRAMRHYFDHIEGAIAEGHFEDATERLDALIAFAREHFTTSEGLARGAGLAAPAAGRLVHEALISRACVLRARFQGERDWESAGETMQNELVALLSDIVESDQRVEGRVNMAMHGTQLK
ncbi:hypothetical protein ACFL12_06420 [Pseudomonadota bacterium]